MSNLQEKIEWGICVPIFRNTVILKQLGIAIGIPFGVLILFLALSSGSSTDARYALLLVSALFLLTWLLIMLLYRGNYEAEFVLDGKGALCRTQAKQAKQNKILNTLTVVLGLLSGKPTIAGAGMLAQSRQSEFLKWSHVTKIKFLPRKNTILLRGGWMDHIALFCAQENYPEVEQFVRTKTKHLKGG